MLESAVQSKILKYLKSRGIYVFKVISANKSGVPDIIGCLPDGRFLGIEVKTPKTKNNTSALQRHNLAAIEENGGLAMVAWDVTMVDEFLAKEGV